MSRPDSPPSQPSPCDRSCARAVVRALPAVILAAAILFTSGSWASAEHTGSLTSSWLTSLGLPLDLALLVHSVIRKLGHAMAYALFAVLALRAVRAPGSPMSRRAAALAFAGSVALASVDETIQAFAPARGGRVTDVLLDAAGAALALLVALRLATRRGTAPAPASQTATDPEAA